MDFFSPRRQYIVWTLAAALVGVFAATGVVELVAPRPVVASPEVAPAGAGRPAAVPARLVRFDEGAEQVALYSAGQLQSVLPTPLSPAAVQQVSALTDAGATLAMTPPAKAPLGPPILPRLTPGFGAAPEGITAPSFLVADITTGEVLAERAAAAPRPIASLTKLVTAATVLDALGQSELVTISARAVATPATAGHLVAGERLTVRDLVFPLLLESSNDAAEALAEHAGRVNFLTLLNQKARAMGLGETQLVDPSGLAAGNTSTARDLFTLLHWLKKYQPYILDVTRQYRWQAGGHTWENHNPLLAQHNFLGGKTGKTLEAAETFVGLWQTPDNRELAVILLGSRDRLGDIQRLTDAYATRQAPELTLAFVGDIMLDRGVRYMVERYLDDEYSALFTGVPTAAPDIMFGNLEGPISAGGTKRGSVYSFRMEPRVGPVLGAAGFDVLSLANNHIGDWDRRAALDTREFLTSAGVKTVGFGSTGELAAPVVIEKNGYRIGFLAATDVGPTWLPPSSTTAGVQLASDSAWPAKIKHAAGLVDLLVVSYHFGNEYELTPSARQKELAHLAIDNGAAIVVGHHPHVRQPVERYKNGVIAYSLGNFIFDQAFSTETMTGALFEVEVAGGKIVGVRERATNLNERYQPSL